MHTADLIYREAQQLPESLRAEVLDFIGYLRTRHPVATPRCGTSDKLAALEAFFAVHQRDLSGFRFDRQEANER